MEPLEYIRILRRRWYYVVVGLVVGLAAGAVTAPGAHDQPVRYAAVHTLLVDPASNVSINLEQAALLVTTGSVPEQVAEQFGGSLPGTLGATASPEVNALAVRAVAGDPATAAELADAAAAELQDALVADRITANAEQLQAATTTAEALSTQLDAIAAQLGALVETDPGRTALEAQQEILTANYQDALAQQQALEQEPAPIPPLRTLEAATGEPITEGGFQLPQSPVGRGITLGLFGLLIGAGGAIASQRLDTRIRSKEDIEASFGVPVLAEIPPFTGRRDKDELHAVTRPASPQVEAYRALRTALQVATLVDDDEDALPVRDEKKLGAVQHRDGEAKVILVASPGASEGKTTTVANLAVVLAEVGKQVLVVSADFRRPRVHQLFDLPREPGLSDVLTGEDRADRPIRLSSLHLQSDVPRVSLLPSGSPVTNPAPFLREAAQLIAAARRLFDYVLIDTAPILVANDASELAGVADAVVMVARADRTHRSTARRAAELLGRLDAPLIGSVLIAANDTPSAYAYYRYRYYADSEDTGRRRGRRNDAEAAPLAPDASTAIATPAPDGTAEHDAAPVDPVDEGAGMFRSSN